MSPLRVAVSIAAGLAGAGAVIAAQQPASPASAALKTHIMTTPADVQGGSCPAMVPPGAQCAVLEGELAAPDRMFAYRLKMPSGYRIPPHYHPADEHLVVMQWTFHVGMGDAFDARATKPMVDGSFAVLPKGAPHYAWADGDTIIQVYAMGPWGMTFVNPADDPRNQKTSPAR